MQLDWHWHWHWPYVSVLGPVRLAAGFFSSQNVFVNTMDMHARFYIHGATPEEDKHASSPARPVHSVVRAVVLGMVHRMMQGVVHAMA